MRAAALVLVAATLGCGAVSAPAEPHPAADGDALSRSDAAAADAPAASEPRDAAATDAPPGTPVVGSPDGPTAGRQDAALPPAGGHDAAPPPTGGQADDGQACTTGGGCRSGICVMGVCCRTACPVETPCGNTGACGRDGACVKADARVLCAAEQCQGDTYTARRLCDGRGACEPPSSDLCPDQLHCGPANTCLTTCGSNADCRGGLACQMGRCGQATADGGGCQRDDQCNSGHCVGGICCRTACPAQPPCGNTGACSAQGTCVKAGRDVACRAQSCADGTLTRAQTCDGKGGCPASAGACPGGFACADAQSCSTVVCRPGTGPCLTADGPGCVDPAACQAKCPVPAGTTATASTTFPGDGADQAIDADDGSSWNAGQGDGSLVVTFPAPRRLRGVFIIANAAPADVVEHYAISGDGAAIGAADRTVPGTAGELDMIPVREGEYRQLTIAVTNAGPQISWIAINSVRIQAGDRTTCN